MKVTISNTTSLTVERGRFGTKIENHDDDSKIFKINVPKKFAQIKSPMLKKDGLTSNSGIIGFLATILFISAI